MWVIYIPLILVITLCIVKWLSEPEPKIIIPKQQNPTSQWGFWLQHLFVSFFLELGDPPEDDLIPHHKEPTNKKGNTREIGVFKNRWIHNKNCDCNKSQDNQSGQEVNWKIFHGLMINTQR